MKRLFVCAFVGSVLLNVALSGKDIVASAGTGTSYPLLSPRIFAQRQNDIIINFTDLRSQLRSFVPAQQNIHASVYFEYLPSGTSIGVQEKDNFISASLIKVPMVMGVSKLIEMGKLSKDTIITLREQDLDSNFGTLWKRGAGATLTVEDAIRLTLTASDNTAALALDALVPTDPIRDVYAALDIPVDWSGDQPVVSAKNYASVFRCLYLSCFLSYAQSQNILTLLTQTKFTDGIPAGVPQDIPVAHKIGMYDSTDGKKRVRLDCGIVYMPNRPYILCILGESTKGNETLIIDFARQVSAKVYQFVANANADRQRN